MSECILYHPKVLDVPKYRTRDHRNFHVSAMFCGPLFVFVLFLLAIVLSVHLQFTASDYPFVIPLLDESQGYIGILMSVCQFGRLFVRHTFCFLIIIKVPLNQIFSSLNTMLWTIKYRLSWITVCFTFTVPELWPSFS